MIWSDRGILAKGHHILQINHTVFRANLCLKVFMALLLATVVSGCGPSVVRTAQPTQPANKVLVITGVGMVTRNAGDARVEETWFNVAANYAKSLDAAMAEAGINVHLHVKKDRAESPKDVLSRLAKDNKKDALIQVAVVHQRSSIDNTFYLEAYYMPLAYQDMSNGERLVVPQKGPVKRYPMLSSTTTDMRDASLSGLAQAFVKELLEQGYISK